MSGVVAPYNEERFINYVINNHPESNGWVYKDSKNGEIVDWFYVIVDRDPITNNAYYKNKIQVVNDVKCYFNKFGRCVEDVFLFGEIDTNVSEFLVSDCKDRAETSINDFSILEKRFAYSKGKEGLVTGEIRLKLKDNKYHTFVFDEDGYNSNHLTVDGKLCINGLIADKYMIKGPSKKYGTVMRNGLPYLCDDTGKLLNLQLSKYYDEDKNIYVYVNSDKTFFFSNDDNDEKWY